MNLGLTEQIQLAVRTGLELGAPDYKSGALKARLFLAFAKKKQKTKTKTRSKNRKQNIIQKTKTEKKNMSLPIFSHGKTKTN